MPKHQRKADFGVGGVPISEAEKATLTEISSALQNSMTLLSDGMGGRLLHRRPI
jgi:hypothetical protein